MEKTNNTENTQEFLERNKREYLQGLMPTRKMNVFKKSIVETYGEEAFNKFMALSMEE